MSSGTLPLRSPAKSGPSTGRLTGQNRWSTAPPCGPEKQWQQQIAGIPGRLWTFEPSVKTPLGDGGSPQLFWEIWVLLSSGVTELLVAGTVSEAGAALGRAPRGSEVLGWGCERPQTARATPGLHRTQRCCHIQRLPTATQSWKQSKRTFPYTRA